MVQQVHITLSIIKVGNNRKSPSSSPSFPILINSFSHFPLFHPLIYFTFHRWDEWVPESRMLKFNEENQRKRKALIDSMQKPPPAKEKKEAAPRKSVGNGKEKEKDDKMECRGTKRARETVEQVSTLLTVKGKGWPEGYCEVGKVIDREDKEEMR